MSMSTMMLFVLVFVVARTVVVQRKPSTPLELGDGAAMNLVLAAANTPLQPCSQLRV